MKNKLGFSTGKGFIEKVDKAANADYATNASNSYNAENSDEAELAGRIRSGEPAIFGYDGEGASGILTISSDIRILALCVQGVSGGVDVEFSLLLCRTDEQSLCYSTQGAGVGSTSNVCVECRNNVLTVKNLASAYIYYKVLM